MANEKSWTVESVKEQLPDVKVKCGKLTLIGHVRGRKNRFATVWYEHPNYKKQYEFEVAWETIVYCLNNDKPIT